MVKISVITGRGIPLRGDDIDTDRIIPARYLRAITFDGLGQHAFEDDRKAGPHPFDEPAYQGASILIVNRNFGCGSSREHAPQALHRWGIHAIVGESFAGIFFGNATMIGLPCATAAHDDIVALMARVEQEPADEIRVDLEAGLCQAGNLQCSISLPPRAREALLTGAWDTTGMLLEDYHQVEAAARRLPYVTGF
jgi:3-isopropylmalate/(R)-2-methylmalate dehydratase small subunit